MCHLTRNGGFHLSASTHTVSCRLRLQFPFVFCQAQSLQLLPLAHPCFLAFAFWLLWALLSTAFTPLPVGFLTSAVFAFFRPLQFWILTTQPLFLLFLLFTVPPHSGFPAASFRFRFQIFHFLLRLVSRASIPASSTQLSCMFPFTLP